MHTRIIKALVDTKGKTVGGQVVPMPAGSYHEVSGFDLDYYLGHPDVFTVYAETSGPPVYANTDKLTGGIDYFPRIDRYARRSVVPRTDAGSFVGNGTTQDITLGYRPSLVVVKGNTTQYAVFRNDANFMDRTDHFLNIASIESLYGITITDTGFTVGSDSKVNANAITYYYLAFADNRSDNLLQGNWAGNASAGRTVNIFSRKPLAGAICKRDSAQSAVYVVGDKASNYFYNGATNAVSTGTTLDSESGVLTLGSGAEINQWTGLLGEGVNCLAFAKHADAVSVQLYTGTGAARSVSLPWIPEAFILVPRDVSVASSRLWISSFPSGNHASLSNSVGLATGDFTVSGSRIVFAGAGSNATGVEYVVYSFRKMRSTNIVQAGVAPLSIKQSVELASGGYIDCGTSDTLQISGAITLEWYGSLYLPDITQYSGTADIDTLAGNQDKLTPLIFRSSGADGVTGAVSFGMAVAAGQVSVDTYVDACLLVATHGTWGLLQSSASGNLDNHPFNTGVVVKRDEPVHIISTHDGSGGWVIYINGLPVKERKRNLATNIVGQSGHKTLIGGRLRTTIDNTNGMSFRLARVYARALTQNEALDNYLSLSGRSTVTGGFAEQWSADDASGATLSATINSANNGSISGGVVIGV